MGIRVYFRFRVPDFRSWVPGWTWSRYTSETGSYLRLIDFVYHTTLGLRVIKKRRRDLVEIFDDLAQLVVLPVLRRRR